MTSIAINDHLTLDYEAVSPSQDEILTMFSSYLSVSGESGPVIPINGSYGAIHLPQHLPKVVVSVDFCEVLRRTGRTCAVAVGNFNAEYPYNDAVGLSEVDTMALVRKLMKADQIAPTEDAASMLHIMQAIRARGGLVIGNTSTLAGCEEPTLRFMSKHYPGAFDGINFNTGGHLVTGGGTTKAQAVLNILRQIDPSYEVNMSDVVIFSIDDRPHHNRSFDHVFRGAKVYSYAPRCLGEKPTPEHENSVVTDTPLAAFEAMYAITRDYLATDKAR